MSAFLTTRWSLVLQAGKTGEQALEDLCTIYWPPLLAYALRRGLPVEDARDVTQSFFEALLKNGWLARADEERGKFRSFLLKAMQRFVDQNWRAQHTLKRGGGTWMLSLDDPAVQAEVEQLGQYPEVSPVEAFDRRWALMVLARAVQRLEKEAEAAGRSTWFAALRPFLSAPGSNTEYAAAGAPLGLSTNSFAQAVLRLRGRYRQAVRSEIAETVGSPAMVDEEMNSLIAAIRGGGG